MTVDLGQLRTGVVASYDAVAGYGEIEEHHGTRWWFHCTAIEDGSRMIAPGTSVRFRLVPGHLGRHEATAVKPM